MKFSMDSELDFEARSRDEALLKLALHFVGLMGNRPKLLLENQPPLDVLGALIKNMPSLNDPVTKGFIDIDVHGDFDPPEMIQ